MTSQRARAGVSAGQALLSVKFRTEGTKAPLINGFAANVIKRWYQRAPLALPGESQPSQITDPRACGRTPINLRSKRALRVSGGAMLRQVLPGRDLVVAAGMGSALRGWGKAGNCHLKLCQRLRGLK